LACHEAFIRTSGEDPDYEIMTHGSRWMPELIGERI
jgi:hypothetical protein